MNSKLALITTYVGLSEAHLAFWSCPKDFPEVENFDKARFAEGTWYEVRRDKAHDSNARQKCVVYDYQLEGDNMSLNKLGQKKNGNDNNDKPKDIMGMKIGGKGLMALWDYLGSSEVPYINHKTLFWGSIQHYVVDTDYDNFALVYGCRNIYYLPFLPMSHYKYATLLSRHEFLEYQYVKPAKDFLKTREYPAS